MTISVLQSDYIPWKGYFSIIKRSDLCIIYDDVQFTRRDWRNRNLIKTPAGLKWLTIPVKSKGRYHQLICDTKVSDHSWAKKHLKALELNYSGSAYFDSFREVVRGAYINVSALENLSDINSCFIELCCSLLNISTELANSARFTRTGTGSDAILSLCKQSGASVYLTGPSGLNYLDTVSFDRSGIKIEVIDYTQYKEYSQPWPPFCHNVTVLDLIFCTGNQAGDLI
jgi:hypothetical protein